MKRLMNNNLAETSSFSNAPNHPRYECKTCGKKFDTFQALGGHQGTHRKLKSIDDGDVCLLSLQMSATTTSHRCKMCSKKFDTGQALGGHMRRHKADKELILMDRGLLQRRLAVEEKLESDLVVEDVELRRQTAEEDEQERVRSELVLAARELRLGI